MKTSMNLTNHAAVLQLAITAHREGRLHDAKAGYMRILQSDKRHADALHLLGLVHLHLGDLVEAERLIRKALAVSESAIFWANLGILLTESKRLPEAEAACLRALQLKPNHVDALYTLGILLTESKRLTEAEAACRRTLELKPGHVGALNNLGHLLKESHRLAEAETTYRLALELKPDHVDAHCNLGTLLAKSKRMSEAEAAYRRALEFNPGHVDAHYNLGLLLTESKRLSEAEAVYRRTLELKPDCVGALNNLGHLLKDSHRLAEAEAAYRRARELKPDDAEIRFNLSVLLLAGERYDEAWPLYESRNSQEEKENRVNMPPLSYPQWQGESLLGKSLVIWPEQGFGDYIQFVRYVSLIKARGTSRLTLVCATPLATLFETVDGVDAVVTDMAQLPAHDYWAFVLSLPLHCGTTAATIPVPPLPYVHPLQARRVKWRDRLPATGVKIGLVWKGSSGHKNDANRSLPGLACLAPLWSVKGVTFLSLQKGQGEEEASQPPVGQPLMAFGAEIADFADTAAIVSQLDLVICVDTAIAHLAGAMGKRCWVLLPAIGTDWRWQYNRTDSPWYPDMRLFRQSDLKDWSETVAKVASELKTWASMQS
jgi:Flp pilus assembly protein TadD